MYKCIKGFSLEKCDDDGFTIEGEYTIIEKGSTWYIPEDEDYRLIGGEIRLEEDKPNEIHWIEISKETLEEHFRKQPVCFIPNDDTYPLCKAKRNRCNEVFITCQTCNLYEGEKNNLRAAGKI